MKAREPRTPLTIPAQVKTDGAPINVTIRNVSSQGMMLSGTVMPSPGSYVEIIRGTLVLAGRVVWSAADLCGVRTHAKINDALLKRGCFKEPQAGEARTSDLGVPNLLPDEDPSALLRDLRRLHDGLVDAISALQVLLARQVVDRATLAQARLRLTKASGERLKFIETEIHPHLEQWVSPFDRAILEQLRNESFVLRGNSTRHVAAWSLDRIVENWTGYLRASAEMLTAMRRRVEREKTVLYPLLQMASAGSADDASLSCVPYREAC